MSQINILTVWEWITVCQCFESLWIACSFPLLCEVWKNTLFSFFLKIPFVLSAFQFKLNEIKLFEKRQEEEKKTRKEFMTQHKVHITAIYLLKPTQQRGCGIAFKFKMNTSPALFKLSGAHDDSAQKVGSTECSFFFCRKYTISSEQMEQLLVNNSESLLYI